VSNLVEPWKILEQRLRWNPADIEKHIQMSSQQKESGIHPKRPAAVRQDDFQLREVDRNIVNEDRVAVAVARARKNRRSGVEHDWNAIGLRGAVDGLQFFHPIQIVVRK